jgi:hypothetical protein
MLSHCANPQCSKPFLRLRQGKLFLVETQYTGGAGEFKEPAPTGTRQKKHQRVERYWLCDQCAAVWTLVHDRNRGIALARVLRPPSGARVEAAECSEVA